MPMEYTGRVADGSINTLKQYALACAPALFGDDFNIKNFPEVDDYYWEIARDAWENLKSLESENTEVAKATAFSNAKNQADLDRAIQIAENKTMLANYRKMVDLVENWKVSTKLESLKHFMLNQLHASIVKDDLSDYFDQTPAFHWSDVDEYYDFCLFMAKDDFERSLSILINEVYSIETLREQVAELKESL